MVLEVDLQAIAITGSHAIIVSLWALPLAAAFALVAVAALRAASKNIAYIVAVSLLFLSPLFVFGAGLSEYGFEAAPTTQLGGEAQDGNSGVLAWTEWVLWNYDPIWIFGTWLFGFAIGVVRIVGDHAALRQLVARAKPPSYIQQKSIGYCGRILVLLSDEVTCPFACFATKPVIVVPSAFCDTLSPRHRRQILKHELVHILRGDLHLVWAERFLGCLFFFNPAFFILRSVIRSLREVSADELAAKTQVSRRELAGALAKLAEGNHRQKRVSLATASAYFDVAQRVALLLDIQMSKGVKARKRINRLLLAGFLAFLSVSGYAAEQTSRPLDGRIADVSKSDRDRAVAVVEALYDQSDLLYAQSEEAFAWGRSATGERLRTQAQALEVRARERSEF